MKRKVLKLEEFQRMNIQDALETIGFKKPVIVPDEDGDDEGDDTYEEHCRAESWSGRYV